MESLSPMVQGAPFGIFRITETLPFPFAVGVAKDGLPSISVTAFGLQDLRLSPDGEPTKSSGLPKPEWPALVNDAMRLAFIFPLEVLESSSECRDLESGGLKFNRDATGA
jgi:hypothetical protein